MSDITDETTFAFAIRLHALTDQQIFVGFSLYIIFSQAHKYILKHVRKHRCIIIS